MYCYENGVCPSVCLKFIRNPTKATWIAITKFGALVGLNPSNRHTGNHITNYFQLYTNWLDISDFKV